MWFWSISINSVRCHPKCFAFIISIKPQTAPFYKWPKRSSQKPEGFMLSVIITLSAQDFPPAKRFMKLVSWKLDTSECFLIGLAAASEWREKAKCRAAPGSQDGSGFWSLILILNPGSPSQLMSTAWLPQGSISGERMFWLGDSNTWFPHCKLINPGFDFYNQSLELI